MPVASGSCRDAAESLNEHVNVCEAIKSKSEPSLEAFESGLTDSK